MGLNLESIDGQTPIDEDEKHGLLIKTITTRGELDEFEQQNIEEAISWVYKRKFRSSEVFTEKFIRKLHHKMYGQVWVWAGEFRKTNKNLGIDKHGISVEVKKLCDDALYWMNHATYSPDEIALRFKHRIVSIHCFPNGNGRHSRLIADIINEKLFGGEPFTWGAAGKHNEEDVRNVYLKAVRQADQGNLKPLHNFARS